MKTQRPVLRIRTLLAFLLVASLVMFGMPGYANHTPDPTSVTIAGGLQSELGCGGDWDPACAATHLSYDVADDVWQGSWSVPAGSFEYKAALNDAWDENYGLNATAGGNNIPLNLGTAASVKFYYDHKTHWVTDNQNSIIAGVAGSFQTELGSPGDWDPTNLRSWLQDLDGDGIYSFSTTALPAGDYEAKVAINESWTENYGAGGIPDGDNIPFNVPSNGLTVNFVYNPTTHILSILTGGSLVIVKQALGSDATFAFTTTGGGSLPADFDITTSGGFGWQTFYGIEPGTYSLAESPLAGWASSSASCDSGTPASFTITEGGTVTCFFSNILTATGAQPIGFWQSKNGQAIIKNDGATAGVCNLTTWLREFAPFQDLSPIASCNQVAAYVTNKIKSASGRGTSMNAMLKAQMLATALDVYFSEPALGGNQINAPAPIGDQSVDLTHINKPLGSDQFEDCSGGFGGDSSLTVMQMLEYAASQSNPVGSMWYSNNKATQELAKDAFDAVNNQKFFVPNVFAGWGNLQWPPTLTHTISVINRTDNVYGQVFIDGLTSLPGKAPALRAQLGFGPEGSNPAGNPDWTWVEASFNVDAGQNDEFGASLLPEEVGVFDYVYRYGFLDSGLWLYADLNGPIPDGNLPPNPGKLTVNSSGDTTPPAVPTGLLVISASPTAIDLAWDAISGDASLYGYEVMRSDASGGPYSLIARVTGDTFSDVSVVEGATYYYVVRAVDTSFNRSGFSSEVSAQADLRTVTLIFNVTVPATTDATGRSVYIAGFLNRLDGGLPDWNPGGVVLTRADATHWTITLTGPESTQIEYKYALFDWDHVENDNTCGEIVNRQLTLTYGSTGTQTVNDTVLNWRNVAPCGN